jgi:PAS domain S-box-containing protein
VNQPPSDLDVLDAQRLQLIAAKLPALLAYIDAEARYVWVNEAYRRWFGDAPESIRGRHMRDLVGAGAWATIEPHLRRALAGEEVTYETPIRYGPGHERDIRVSYFPDKGRDPTGLGEQELRRPLREAARGAGRDAPA